MAEESVYEVWLVLRNGYQLDGYYESGGERVPEAGDTIVVKSLSGGSHRATVTRFAPDAKPPIHASELAKS